MSGRGASAAVQAEIQKRSLHAGHLFIFDFGPTLGTLRLTDLARKVVYLGYTYWPTGQVLNFTPITETAEPTVQRATFELTGVDSALVTHLVTANVVNRPCYVYKIILDEYDRLLDAPVQIFQGKLDAPYFNFDPEKGTATVGVTAASRWVNFTMLRGRRASHSEQQLWFPGDMGFEFVPQMVNATIEWGP